MTSPEIHGISNGGATAEARGLIALDEIKGISTAMALRLNGRFEWHHVKRGARIVEMPFVNNAADGYEIVLRGGAAISAKSRLAIWRKLFAENQEIAIDLLGETAGRLGL